MYSIILQKIFHEYLNKNLKINTSFVSPGLRLTSFNLIHFHFYIRGQLSIKLYSTMSILHLLELGINKLRFFINEIKILTLRL